MAETTFRSIQLPNMNAPARVPEVAGEFSSLIHYHVRDYCTYQGQLYICTQDHQPHAWNAQHFELTNIDNEFDGKLKVPIYTSDPPLDGNRVGDLCIDTSDDSPIVGLDVYPVEGSHNPVQSDGIRQALNSINRLKTNNANICGDFSKSATYNPGDYTLYDGQLYKCIVTHKSKAWNASHFKATSVSTELNNRLNDITLAVSTWLNQHPDSIVGLTAGSVQEAHLANDCVTENKVARDAITTDKIKNNTITADKLISSFVLPIEKGGTGSSVPGTALTNLGAQKKINKYSNGELTTDKWNSSSGNWIQNLEISEFKKFNEFIASPNNISGWDAAIDATLYPPKAYNGGLKFTCKQKPTAPIPITVYWW